LIAKNGYRSVDFETKINCMQKPEILYSFTRLIRKLPLHDASRLAYVKSKFNWIVCDFTEEFFGNTEACLRVEIVRRIFDLISIHERRYDINTVEKLLEQVGNLYVEIMLKEDAELLVSHEFFLQQFAINFRMRYRMLDDFISKFYHLFLKKLKTHNVSDPESILGLALDQIDEKMSHPLSETDFISQWLYNVANICVKDGFGINIAKFMV
jgi:hypothetical protein